MKIGTIVSMPAAKTTGSILLGAAVAHTMLGKPTGGKGVAVAFGGGLLGLYLKNKFLK